MSKEQSPIVGHICVHPAGYGFVSREDGEDDVFIAARNRGAALDGDRVAIATWPGWKGLEGRVIQVVQHGRAKITGVVSRAGRKDFLEPDDPRILGRVKLIGSEDAAAARLPAGVAVVAQILRYPEELQGEMVARVLHVLGDPDDPRTEVAKIIACADIPDDFPEPVLNAAAQAPQEVRPEDLIDRVDLRDREFLTIDPETARDFDDAVCVEDGPRAGLDRLWVAVADVSHYVRNDSALDKEARHRGVSVYLPNRAISMLPSELSAGICSLNPEVDRLAMVARLDIDEKGQVADAQFVAAVIRSRARLDYAGVAAALHGDLRGARARYGEHLPQLGRMRELAQRLRAVRQARGTLDFDLPEAQVLLDQDDPRRVRDVTRSRALPEVREAYRLVEDFMLAANEAVAHFFAVRKLDTLWRVHARPQTSRLADFVALSTSLGIPMDTDTMQSPPKLREFLARVEGSPMARSLSYFLLRAMKQATYDVENIGHFGLASPEYLHFTSPIRRYPDLVVHRLLKRQLASDGLPAGGSSQGHEPAPSREALVQQATASSSHERRAMEAEREVVDMYRAFLMREHIGEEFAGTIVGVTAFGLFVELQAPFVEGLIKAEKLGPERFTLDEHSMRLLGERSGRAFALGEAVRVRIENVSVPRRQIELELVEVAERPTPSRATPSHRSKGRSAKSARRTVSVSGRSS